VQNAIHNCINCCIAATAAKRKNFAAKCVKMGPMGLKKSVFVTDWVPGR
tara:strand:+ start:374 stop:520 length:147 start_codon:yes stop_codon:yes gene_type:complete